MELWAGVRTQREEAILEKQQETIPLIGFSDENFIVAGKLMNKMKRFYRFESQSRRRLTWDILIALSARENHACFLTENKDDFERIQKFLDFDFIPLPQ